MLLRRFTLWTLLMLPLTSFAADVPADPAAEPRSVLDEAPAMTPTSAEYAEGRSLSVYAAPAPVTTPHGASAADPVRPAIVLVHGGGWGGGTPALMDAMARYYAARGLVAVNVGYRLTKQPGIRVGDCVADVHAAVAWVRQHAADLGVDPQRIAVAGDSAGGHLAATCGPMAVPAARANALVLYNPVIDTASADGWKMKGYTDAERLALSPAHHVARDMPPTLVIHGELDTVVPIAWSLRYVAAMKDAGNDATLVRLPDCKHAFVIPGYGTAAGIDAAMAATDAFLKRLGYLR